MSSWREQQRYEGPTLPPERAWLLVGYQRIVTLARERFPLTITPDGNPSPQEDWRVVRAAFLARIARTAEVLSALVPLDAHLDGIDLARNTFEHALCLAWIAADPDTRFEVWLKKDYQSRLDYDKHVRARLAERTEARWKEQPVDEAHRAAYLKFVRRVQGDLPGIPKMCQQADDYWLSRYPGWLAGDRTMSFVDLYTYIYHWYSWMAHPRLIGLQYFWDLGSQWTVVHAKETGGREHDPLHMGQMLAGQGLLLSAMATGTPKVEDVADLLNANAELARLVREGKLITKEDGPGKFEMQPLGRHGLAQSP